jgi:two-component system response regulator FixJ
VLGRQESLAGIRSRGSGRRGPSGRSSRPPRHGANWKRRRDVGGGAGPKMTAPDEPVVFIIDDDVAVARSLAALLGSVGVRSRVYSDAQAFLDHLTPDARGCILSDLRMPEMSGLDLQRAIAEKGLRLPIILFSGYGDVHAAVRAMKQGAVDFLEKPIEGAVLVERVRECLRLETHAARERAQVADYKARLLRLTAREREIMHHLVQGLPSKQIATCLEISRKTVDVHRYNIFAKTEFRNVAELIRAVMLIERHDGED